MTSIWKVTCLKFRQHCQELIGFLVLFGYPRKVLMPYLQKYPDWIPPNPGSFTIGYIIICLFRLTLHNLCSWKTASIINLRGGSIILTSNVQQNHYLLNIMNYSFDIQVTLLGAKMIMTDEDKQTLFFTCHSQYPSALPTAGLRKLLRSLLRTVANMFGTHGC
jgi:hypothetical protein